MDIQKPKRHVSDEERALRNAKKFQLWCEYLHGNWWGHELGKLKIEEQLRELGCRVIEEKWGYRLVEIDEDESKETSDDSRQRNNHFDIYGQEQNRTQTQRGATKQTGWKHPKRGKRRARGARQGPRRASQGDQGGAGKGDPRGEDPHPHRFSLGAFSSLRPRKTRQSSCKVGWILRKQTASEMQKRIFNGNRSAEA